MDILKYDLEGNFLERIKDTDLDSLAKSHKITIQSLREAIRGITLSSGGFQWKEALTKDNLIRIGSVWQLMRNTAKPKVIGKYYNGRLICTYTKIEEAAKKNNINKGGVYHSLSGRTLIQNGFEFKYLN